MSKIRWKRLFSPKARAISRADTARDNREPAAAARLYREVIDRWGASHALLMQLGNALKDSGSFSEAEQAYCDALAITATDADTYLQYGHLMKLSGKPADAEAYYRKALDLDPQLTAARDEIDAVLADRASAETKQLGSAEAEHRRLSIRTDMPLPASIVYLRLVNEHRWRRG